MNLQETLASIFPGCTDAGPPGEDGVVEVGGITGSMVPKNCEVLASGVFQYSSSERPRRSYLVKANDCLLLVRILPDASNHLCAQIIQKPLCEGLDTQHIH
jgi:hypothetical protein